MQLKTGLTNTRVFALAIHANGNIFAGTFGGGVFISKDFGENWINVNSGLMNLRIRSLAINANSYIFSGTDGGGLFRSVQSITGVYGSDEDFLPSHVLFQNYPNPFNPSTIISFDISIQTNVQLKIYDLLGNEVATLVNEVKPVGSYNVEFNASHLASGIYYYTLNAGDFHQTKKLILLK